MKRDTCFAMMKIINIIISLFRINVEKSKKLLMLILVSVCLSNLYAGYCPIHSGSEAKSKEVQAKMQEEVGKEIAKKIVESNDFLRFCDRMYKTVDARWADKVWVAHKVSTAVGTVLNQAGNLLQLKGNMQELTQKVSTLILSGPDGLVADYQNYGNNNDFFEFGYNAIYVATAAVLNDKQLLDELAEDIYNKYEDKNWLLRIGFDSAYKFTAWVLGDYQLLECTHASPNCPKEDSEKKASNDNDNDDSTDGDMCRSGDDESDVDGDMCYPEDDTEATVAGKDDNVSYPQDNQNSSGGNDSVGESVLERIGGAVDSAADNLGVVLPTIPHYRVLWMFSGESWTKGILSAKEQIQDLLSEGSFSKVWENFTGEIGYKDLESAIGRIKGDGE